MWALAAPSASFLQRSKFRLESRNEGERSKINGSLLLLSIVSDESGFVLEKYGGSSVKTAAEDND